MWDGFNQRKYPRIPLRCRVTIFPGKTNKQLRTQTQDISLGGMCIKLKSSIPKMRICRINLQLNTRFKPMKCSGRIAWVVPTTSSARLKSKRKNYDIGIEFVNVPSEMKEQLNMFIGKHIFRV